MVEYFKKVLFVGGNCDGETQSVPAETEDVLADVPLEPIILVDANGERPAFFEHPQERYVRTPLPLTSGTPEVFAIEGMTYEQVVSALVTRYGERRT